jgi:hypothetical protein
MISFLISEVLRNKEPADVELGYESRALDRRIPDGPIHRMEDNITTAGNDVLEGEAATENADFHTVSEFMEGIVVVYYETIKRELNTRLIYECRCDEKLKAKAEGSRRLAYTGLRGGLEHLMIKTRLMCCLYSK